MKKSDKSTRGVLFSSTKFVRKELAPVGIVTLSHDPKKSLDLPGLIFNVWWSNCLDVTIPKLMKKPQGEEFYQNLEVDDIILMKE